NFFFKFKQIRKNIGIYHLYIFSNKKWFFDIINSQLIIPKFIQVTYLYFYCIIDKGILEFFGPFGFISFFKFFSINFIKYQTGLIFTYLFIFNIIMFIMVFFLFLSNIIFLEIIFFSILLFCFKFLIEKEKN